MTIYYNRDEKENNWINVCGWVLTIMKRDIYE